MPAIVLAAAVCAGLLTVLVLLYARRKGLLDAPGERRSHAFATPRGGGLSIVLVAGAGLAYFTYLGGHKFAPAALVGLILVAGVGWLDDHRDQSIRIRLAAHIVAAGLLAWGAGLDLSGACCVFAITVVLINVWNFMDGINGIAASQTAVFAAVCAVLLNSPMGTALALLLLGACIGFLPFNFPRARIFMGDVGSGPLGFLIAVLLTLGLQETADPWGRLPLWFPLAPFLVDAGWTLLTRMVKGEAWWTAHVTHVYQLWSRRLGAHTPVTLAYLAVALAGAWLAIRIQAHEPDFIKFSLTLWYITLSIVWWLLRRQGVTRTF